MKDPTFAEVHDEVANRLRPFMNDIEPLARDAFKRYVELAVRFESAQGEREAANEGPGGQAGPAGPAEPDASHLGPDPLSLDPEELRELGAEDCFSICLTRVVGVYDQLAIKQLLDWSPPPDDVGKRLRHYDLYANRCPGGDTGNKLRADSPFPFRSQILAMLDVVIDRLAASAGGNFQPAKWFERAGAPGLTGDLLRQANHRGQLPSTIKRRGRNLYEVGEVCRLFPQFRTQIEKLLESHPPEESAKIPPTSRDKGVTERDQP